MAKPERREHVTVCRNRAVLIFVMHMSVVCTPKQLTLHKTYTNGANSMQMIPIFKYLKENWLSLNPIIFVFTSEAPCILLGGTTQLGHS